MLARYYWFMFLGNHSLISFWAHHQFQSPQHNEEEMDDLLFRLLVTQLGEEFVHGLFCTTNPLPLSLSPTTENLPKLIDYGYRLLERNRLNETIQQLHHLDQQEDQRYKKKVDKDLLMEAYLCLTDLFDQLQQEQVHEDSLFAKGSQIYARLLGGELLERYMLSYIRERQNERSLDIELGP